MESSYRREGGAVDDDDDDEASEVSNLTALSRWAVPNYLSTELSYTQHFNNRGTVSFVTCEQLNHTTWLRGQYLSNSQESLTQTLTSPLTIKVTVLKVTGLSCWLHDLHWHSSPKVSPPIHSFSLLINTLSTYVYTTLYLPFKCYTNIRIEIIR